MPKKGAVAARTAAVKRRTFTREFKLKVIREVEAGKSQAQVAREYQNRRKHDLQSGGDSFNEIRTPPIPRRRTRSGTA